MEDQIANAAQSATSAAQQINWANPNWDLFLILFFVVASLLYGISLGRDRLIVIMVSVYMALAVVSFIPFIQPVASGVAGGLFAVRMTAFLGLFILLFFFLSQTALLSALGSKIGRGPIWHIMLLSILHAGLLISVTLSFFPQSITDALSVSTRNFFISDFAKAVWIILPIFGMMLGKGDKDSD
ncbi:MAG: hypothetical protein ACD_76C00156G0001 [uncultured bacterium]|nr:MAG: hypothetical protein ACD_76C00156G0001 [uncultured bacterium]HBD05175.1 hypothetical protein [Candidatus Uhrbacteria bacterium]